MIDEEFSIRQSLCSGQCFRFVNNGNIWTVYSGTDEKVQCISISENEDFKSFFVNHPYWRNYFDMDTDYALIRRNFVSMGKVMEDAVNYAPGIHILNQDPWETLCSFVISQNNNIKRIKKIIEKLCVRYGRKNTDGIPGFPSAQTICELSETQLKEAGLGFRSTYVLNTANAVINNEISFEVLKNAKKEEAVKMLTSVKGIGPKVANCTLLFGFHRLDCFPLDTWMKKVMNEYFPNQSTEQFGDYAGVAQQHLFHWIRGGET